MNTVEWAKDYNTNDKIIAVLWGFKHFWLTKDNAKRLIYDLKYNTNTEKEYCYKIHARVHNLNSFINYNRYWLNKLINKLHKNMETKEIKINVPDGYEIDKENSTFECIKFKPVAKRWRDDEKRVVKGFYVGSDSLVHKTEVFGQGRYLFAIEKQAKSALAMAQISQIMANDERFGGVVTDEEWKKGNTKYIIYRVENKAIFASSKTCYEFLAFHTEEQRDLFFEENEDLVRDYLMIN